MAVYLVTYDLRQPGRDYEPVYGYLKQMTYCRHVQSVWLVDTQLSAQRIRDDLMALVDRSDIVFVAQIPKNWTGYNFGCANWLNNPARQW